MLKTLNKLKAEVKKSELVANSILGYTDVWKTSHYNTLSAIINENLMKNPLLQGEKKFEIGNTISAITLKRFFDDQISESASNDLRFLKTLDKICIFIGYDDFNDFIQKNKNQEITYAPEFLNDNSDASEIDFEKIILSCAQCEYDFIAQLPLINLDAICQFVIQDSPYYGRIHNYLHRLVEQGHFLSKGLDSNFEVFNIVLKSKNDKSAVISTSEFWNLNFIDSQQQQHHYHTMNEQSYFLKKDEKGTWKIWDNYNPNVWELTDKI